MRQLLVRIHHSTKQINADISKEFNHFQPVSCINTVPFCALTYGQTVLACAIAETDIEWGGQDAHSALYDAEKTAELFCTIVNRYQDLGG